MLQKAGGCRKREKGGEWKENWEEAVVNEVMKLECK